MTDSFTDFFKKNNGKVVKLKGVAYKIKYSEHDAIYPYKHRAKSISLDPVNKRSKEYLATKRKLGDDWSIDAQSLSDEALAEIWRQLK